MKIKRNQYLLIAVAIVIIIAQLSLTDFKDLSWSNNSGGYLTIIAMLLLIVAMIISILKKKKE